MNILHIASFEGNIGDNASHIGFYSILDKLNISYCIEKLEIRKFYKRYTKIDALKFDEEMAKKFNEFDLVVIGGGGFLDYWIEDSRSGTTLDFDLKFTSLITTKVLITSVGAYPHREVPNGNVRLFKKFINDLINLENFKVFFRNDGSIPNLISNIDSNLKYSMRELADHAFFYNEDGFENNRLKKLNYIAINVSDDQLGMNNIKKVSVDKKKYISEISKFIVDVNRDYGYKTILVPHIHQDLVIIGEVINDLDSDFFRSNVFVAPCLQTDAGANEVLSYYKHANIVFASRFHSAVVSLVLGKKVVNISALDRVHYLFEAIGNNRYSFYPNEVNKQILSERTKELLKDESFLVNSNSYCQSIRNKTITDYKNLFSSWNLIEKVI